MPTLQKAGLLRTDSLDKFIITQQGLDVLALNPKNMNLNYLEQFDDFYDFRSISNQDIPR
jgi:restriction system protein